MIRFIWLCIVIVSTCRADYDCICNYNVEAAIYDQPSTTSSPVGYLYEFDCKPKAGQPSGTFEKIMFEHKYAYIEKNKQVETQICAGEIPDEDKVVTAAPVTTGMTSPPSTTQSTTASASSTSTPTTVTSTTQSTTPTSTSTSATTTPKPSTTTQTTSTSTTTQTTSTSTTPTSTTTTSTTSKPTTTPTTTTPTTTTPTTTTSTTTTSTTTPLPITTDRPTTTGTSTQTPQTAEGHTDLCPDYIKKTDVNYYAGFLGQYGNYCYELVNGLTQWENARRHCIIYGDLAHIPNQDVQNYLTKWLNFNNFTAPVWIGLTDSGDANEGTWRWSNGEHYKYNNFHSAYVQHTTQDHKLNDCVVMKPGTWEWTDVPCGVTFLFGAGFGEHHPYICQYNISDAVAHVHFGNVFVG